MKDPIANEQLEKQAEQIAQEQEAKSDDKQEERMIPATQHNEQLNRLRGKLSETQAAIESLTQAAQEKDATVDSLKKQIDEMKHAHLAMLDKVNEDLKRSATQARLAELGCIDTPAAFAHLDFSKIELKDGELLGLDAKALKEARPYLFKSAPTVNTSAPQGTRAAEDEFTKALNTAFKKG